MTDPKGLDGVGAVLIQRGDARTVQYLVVAGGIALAFGIVLTALAASAAYELHALSPSNPDPVPGSATAAAYSVTWAAAVLLVASAARSVFDLWFLAGVVAALGVLVVSIGALASAAKAVDATAESRYRWIVSSTVTAVLAGLVLIVASSVLLGRILVPAQAVLRGTVSVL